MTITNPFDLSDEHPALTLICTREAIETFIYGANHNQASQGTLLARIWKWTTSGPSGVNRRER